MKNKAAIVLQYESNINLMLLLIAALLFIIALVLFENIAITTINHCIHVITDSIFRWKGNTELGFYHTKVKKHI